MPSPLAITSAPQQVCAQIEVLRGARQQNLACAIPVVAPRQTALAALVASRHWSSRCYSSNPVSGPARGRGSEGCFSLRRRSLFGTMSLGKVSAKERAHLEGHRQHGMRPGWHRTKMPASACGAAQRSIWHPSGVFEVLRAPTTLASILRAIHTAEVGATASDRHRCLPRSRRFVPMQPSDFLCWGRVVVMQVGRHACDAHV